MATNYLAPPTYNSLLNDVPPLEPPPYVPPRPMRFGQRLENLSIGAGRGVTEQLQSAADFIRSPVQVTRETLQQLAAMYDDPRLALEMLREVRRKAASGPLGMGEVIGSFAPLRAPGGRRPTMQELDVYHGTPHRFDPEEGAPLGRFRSEKIGTGEGAQAYGYGLYFAESPNVAGQYKASTSANMYDTSKGVIRSSDLVDELFKQSGDIPKNLESAYRAKANEVVRDLIMGKSSSEISQEIRTSKYGRTYNALADAVDNLFPKKASGQIYLVDLPDEQIAKMLDWDKPLSEQPEILAKLKKIGLVADDGIVQGVEMARGTIKDITGQQIIDDLAMQWSNDYGLNSLLAVNAKTGQEAASKYLASLGIPGIRYLDAGSRYGTGGTRNFVVFPGEEQNLRILERK